MHYNILNMFQTCAAAIADAYASAASASHVAVVLKARKQTQVASK